MTLKISVTKCFVGMEYCRVYGPDKHKAIQHIFKFLRSHIIIADSDLCGIGAF